MLVGILWSNSYDSALISTCDNLYDENLLTICFIRRGLISQFFNV